MPRKFVSGDEQPRDDITGQYQPIPEDRKQACLSDVKPMLLTGATLVQVAAKHQIHPRTLDFWLAQLGDEYKEVRKQWIDYKLNSAEGMMEDASDPFKLAKGRELARMAMWRAERRDPERYADKREITHKTDEPQTPDQVREKIKQLEAKLGIRVIEGEQQAA